MMLKTLSNLVVIVVNLALSAVPAFSQPAGQPPRGTDKVAGWKAAPDPSEFKGKLRADIRLTIPIKHSIVAADAARPGAILAVCDANPFGPRQWGSINLQTGTYAPAFADKAEFEHPHISPDGALLAGKVQPEHMKTPGLEIWNC